VAKRRRRRLKPEKPGFNLETNNEAAPSW